MNLLTLLIFALLPADTLATFPGGDKAFDAFIIENLKTTQAAIDAKINGEVFIKFTIDEKGTAGKFVVQKPLGYGCDEEAIAVLQAMPAWQPMVINNRRAKATFTRKFSFTPDLKISSRKAPKGSVPNGRSSFGDSDESLQKFITDNFVYPSKKNIDGPIVVQFRVTAKGATDEVRLINGLDSAIDNEVVRVLTKLDKWDPKRENFNPVNEYRTIVFSVKKKKLLIQELK
ncbi:MAG TPA: energy transducer TonB [Cyclobacteriaceae bacterium]|nr:energy transducer TonB [Cyclobacteriaceae bacterium]